MTRFNNLGLATPSVFELTDSTLRAGGWGREKIEQFHNSQGYNNFYAQKREEWDAKKRDILSRDEGPREMQEDTSSKTPRTAEVLKGKKWQKIDCKKIKKGDTFRLIESNGSLVADKARRTVFHATSNASMEDDTWGIECTTRGKK